MKKAILIAVMALIPLRLSAVQTPIYSVLSDAGIAGDDIYIWGPQAGSSVVLSSAATTPTPPEGIHSMQATTLSKSGTWAIAYLNPNRSNRSVDLSAYSSGEIRFWANCSTDNFDVFIQHLDGSQDGYNYQGVFGSSLNQWVPVYLPLAGFTLTDIFSPFLITMEQPGGGTCYFDNIRYVNAATPATTVFTVTVKDIASQSTANGITWPTGVLPNGWSRANQYIELNVDNPIDFNWGVQIYTKNTAASANPKYTGAANTNPAGLVDVGNTSMTVPLAWSIKAGTAAPSAVSPVAAEPNILANPNAFQWLYMKDAATPNIPALNTTAFVNGEAFVTVKSNLGIHYGQNNAQNQPSFGAENSPNYIFLEANFDGALAQRTYTTNQLTIEFYSL